MHSVSGTEENSQAHPLYEEALFVSGCIIEPMALETLNRTSKQWEEPSFNDISGHPLSWFESTTQPQSN
jgi:hypothetical protein